ncbi:hypothetical protein [Arcticibacter sp. MXS-1]|uniref:hypothetical protein n=1 Tax=Arcticibacter sp. MXS-1 TaxID=3341726 RepID=UPI0035A96AD3
MKALTTLTAAALLATVFTASADERKEARNETAAILMKAPAFEFGTPADLVDAEVEKLKLAAFKAPEFVWGSADDAASIRISEADMKSASFTAPAFVWGTSEDASTPEVELLKMDTPAFDWGTADDVATLDVELLKFQMPAFNYGTPQDVNEETISSLKK